jgi:putative glutamine amidotransferase
MKKIVITQRIEFIESYGEVRTALDIAWANLLEKYGILLLPISNLSSIDRIFKDIKIDGVILTGGNNLGVITNNPRDVLRDQLDGKVLEYALEKNIPVLAFCRGAQFVAKKYGLIIKPCKGHVTKSHRILWKKEISLIEKTTYPEFVNSYHNYSIEGESSEIIINAVSEDGSIEAFSHKDKPIISLMWHPERIEKLGELENILFSKFI